MGSSALYPLAKTRYTNVAAAAAADDDDDDATVASSGIYDFYLWWHNFPVYSFQVEKRVRMGKH